MYISHITISVFFFFNDTATTEIYTLSLHDALPIWAVAGCGLALCIHGIFLTREEGAGVLGVGLAHGVEHEDARSEEHTSELQSRLHLVCRLLLEKKKRSSQITSTPYRRSSYKN